MADNEIGDYELPPLGNPLGWFALIGKFTRPPTPEDLTNKQYLRGLFHGAAAVKIVEKMPGLYKQIGPVLDYAGTLAHTAMMPIVKKVKAVTTDDIGKVLGDYAASGGNIEKALQSIKTIGDDAVIAVDEDTEETEQVEESEAEQVSA